MTDTQHRAARALAVLDRARAIVATIAAGADPAPSPTARALLTSSRRLLQLLELAHHAHQDHDPAR
jgi:hypothetical protein